MCFPTLDLLQNDFNNYILTPYNFSLFLTKCLRFVKDFIDLLLPSLKIARIMSNIISPINASKDIKKKLHNSIIWNAYLGLPVGARSRSMSTWEPMLEFIWGRLGSWRNKYISLGGRIVLINAVLNAIPIFYLSYIKMPVKVWRELVKIQRQFLWGGLSNQSKTCWVK
jgi:hypothetical protein